MTTRILNKITRNGIDYIPSKLFVIREDMVTVSTTATKGVAPYNTDYYYTNFTISEDAGIGRVEGAVYIFEVKSSMVVASSYRNVRVRIGNSGDYKPVMNWGNTILAGSSYFTLANVRLFQYSKKYQEYGALHCNVDTTYSAMSVDEGKTGTATSARLMRADRLKAIIEYHAGNLDANLNFLKSTDVGAAALSNSYNDLDNKPTIPSVGNATITLVDENNTEIGNFTTNASTNKTITIPSGGGGADTATVNALIDTKLGNYDSLFMSSPGLYKLLNDVTDEDELGLTGGDNWSEIVASQDSMNKISHGWTIMAMLSCSNYALSTAIASNTALSELVASWVSMSILANNKEAMEIIVGSSTAIDAITGSAVAMDAIMASDMAIDEIINSTNVSSTSWGRLFSNSTFANIVYNDNNYLTIIANNSNALPAIMSSSVWSSIMADVSKLNIFMANDNAASYIISNTTSANLRADVPLRSIIQNDRLDSYLAKDDRAYNGVITFDVNAISNTTFKISRYGYNAVTSTWKYSIDGGERTSTSVAASTTALSIDLGSTGNHTVVVKPDTYAVGWARQMGNRSSTNYWNNTPDTIKFSVRNLPGYAFMASDSSFASTGYFMYYMFYGCTSLTGVNIKVPTGATSTGTYYMAYMFYNCTNLTSITGRLFPTGVTTAGNYFMYYMFYGCTGVTNLPSGFNLDTITTSVGTYFLAYFCYGCSTLKALPTGFNLPSVGNSSYYLRNAFYNCTALGADSPTESLHFVNAASNCFTNTSVGTASPSAGSDIPVHRE